MQVLNKDEFTQQVENSQGIVLVDFFATWCGPCRMLAPVLEEASKETTAQIYKVDIDQNQDLCRKYGIMVVPTMLIFQDGKQMDKFSGFMPKEDLLAKLNQYTK